MTAILAAVLATASPHSHVQMHRHEILMARS